MTNTNRPDTLDLLALDDLYDALKRVRESMVLTANIDHDLSRVIYTGLVAAFRAVNWTNADHPAGWVMDHLDENPSLSLFVVVDEYLETRG